VASTQAATRSMLGCSVFNFKVKRKCFSGTWNAFAPSWLSLVRSLSNFGFLYPLARPRRAARRIALHRPSASEVGHSFLAISLQRPATGGRGDRPGGRWRRRPTGSESGLRAVARGRALSRFSRARGAVSARGEQGAVRPAGAAGAAHRAVTEFLLIELGWRVR
jgi:hypothetical protein